MQKIPVTCVVITKNEEDNIADCLKSASVCDEIIVLDDESTDRTRDIAGAIADKVVVRRMDIEGRHRNYGYSLSRNEWVLSLDADERMSGGLSDELRKLFAQDIKDAALTIPIRAYIGDFWIKNGGWYPAAKVRLFRKSKFKYEEAEVHPRVFIDGSCGHLKGDIVHYSYRDFHDFFASLNNQTTLEAKKWFKERRRIGFFKMLRKFIDRFLRTYLFKRGYRDGLIGFVVAYGNGLYQLMSYVKYQFMLREEKCAKQK